MTVGEASQMEQIASAAAGRGEVSGSTRSCIPLVVDGNGRVKVKTNWYSTPLWPGLRVTARVWPSGIEIEHDGNAWRGTSAATGAVIRFSTWNTISTCWRRSRARWRDRRRWSNGGRPDAGRSVWTGSGRNSNERHGKSGGTREMIALVRAGLVSERWMGSADSRVEEALRLGVTDAAAVLHILRMPDAEERRRYEIALSEELAQFERPQPVMDEYDLLLAAPLPVRE